MSHKGSGRGRTNSSKRVGLARYRKEQWQHWLESVDDRESWQETYEAWQQHTEEMAGRLQRAGLEVIFIDLDADQFTQWCKARGYQNDSEARSRYSAEQIGNIPPPANAPAKSPG